MTPELQTTDARPTIRKTYDTTPNKVYDALTQKDLVARWYAPDLKADVRTFEPSSHASPLDRQAVWHRTERQGHRRPVGGVR